MSAGHLETSDAADAHAGNSLFERRDGLVRAVARAEHELVRLVFHARVAEALALVACFFIVFLCVFVCVCDELGLGSTCRGAR